MTSTTMTWSNANALMIQDAQIPHIPGGGHSSVVSLMRNVRPWIYIPACEGASSRALPPYSAHWPTGRLAGRLGCMTQKVMESWQSHLHEQAQTRFLVHLPLRVMMQRLQR